MQKYVICPVKFKQKNRDTIIKSYKIGLDDFITRTSEIFDIKEYFYEMYCLKR